MKTERYKRQIQLKGFGPSGQQALAEAAVLIVGAGGLGVPASQYLNAMGVGRIGLVDGDVIETSNLHRQPAYGPGQVGRLKAGELARWLSAQNPDTVLEVHDTFLHATNALGLLQDYDLVVDATDNLATRYLIDDTALIAGIPWVYGALHGFEGQVSVFNYKDGPTYRCLFPRVPGMGEIPDCNTLGTLGVLPGLIGNLQALEAIKVLCGLPGILSGQLLVYHGLEQEMRQISFRRSDERRAGEVGSLPGQHEACKTATGSITPAEFRQILEDGVDHLLVDVREPEEYHLAHLPCTENIPLLTLENEAARLAGSSAVYFICKSGPRSRQAYEFMRHMHPSSNVFWVAGGIRDFNTENIDRV